MRGLTSLLFIALVLTPLSGCKPNQTDAELQRAERDDKISAEDGLRLKGKYDPMTQQVFKVNGRVFVAPKIYGGYEGVFGFYWPSKTPRADPDAEKKAPELTPSSAGVNSNFYNVAIEFFVLHSESEDRILLLDQAKAAGKAQPLRTVNKSQVWEVKDFPPGRTSGYEIYVADDLKTPKGNPAAVTCSQDNGCTTKFAWDENMHVYVRFDYRHAKDWHDIYAEIARVINLIKEIK